MPASSSSTAKALMKTLSSDRVVGDFVKPIPSLTRSKPKDIGTTFERMAKKLSGTRRAGVVQFRLTAGRKTRCWHVVLSSGDCRAVESEVDAPTAEVIASESTWAEIASGQLAPLDAFVRGQARVRGDIDTMRSVFRRIRRKK